MKLSNEQENWLKFRINKQKEQKEKDLRDYFAAMAMQGEMASQTEDSGYYSTQSYNLLAERSYAIADAMMEARQK